MCCTNLNDKDSDASRLAQVNDKQSGEPGGLSVVVIDLVLIDTRRPQIVAATTWGKKKISQISTVIVWMRFFFILLLYMQYIFTDFSCSPPSSTSLRMVLIMVNYVNEWEC